MATHSSILAWKIPWREETVRLQSMGVSRVGHDIEIKPQPPSLLIHTFKVNYINKYFKSLRNIVSILSSEFQRCHELKMFNCGPLPLCCRNNEYNFKNNDES